MHSHIILLLAFPTPVLSALPCLVCATQPQVNLSVFLFKTCFCSYDLSSLLSPHSLFPDEYLPGVSVVPKQLSLPEKRHSKWKHTHFENNVEVALSTLWNYYRMRSRTWTHLITLKNETLFKSEELNKAVAQWSRKHTALTWFLHNDNSIHRSSG